MVKKTTKKIKPETHHVVTGNELELEALVTENETTSGIRTLNQQEVTPMVMMQMAIAEGSDMATMERLWALNEKVEAANAKKAFFLALSQFKENPPQIIKDKLNSQYNSDYVSIGNMVTTVSAAMGKYGLTHSWTFGEGEKGEIICTCIMAHSLGHQESVTLSAPVDTSGSKNPLQGRKSTRTYLKLETFEAVTGMASVEGNADDDGNAYGEAEIVLISEDEINELDAMLVENEISRKTFSEWLLKDMGVETLDKVPATGLARVRAAIKASIKAKKKEEK